jgi:hypothetical protein
MSESEKKKKTTRKVGYADPDQSNESGVENVDPYNGNVTNAIDWPEPESGELEETDDSSDAQESSACGES